MIQLYPKVVHCMCKSNIVKYRNSRINCFSISKTKICLFQQQSMGPKMIFPAISCNLYLYSAHSGSLEIKQKQEEDKEQILHIACIEMQRTMHSESVSHTSKVFNSLYSLCQSFSIQHTERENIARLTQITSEVMTVSIYLLSAKMLRSN